MWETLDRDNPSVRKGLADALTRLGISWSNRGEYGTAEPFLSRSVTLWETLDQDNPSVRKGLADILDNLCISLSNQNIQRKLNKALSRWRQAITVLETIDPKDPRSKSRLAQIYIRLVIAMDKGRKGYENEMFLFCSKALKNYSELENEGQKDDWNHSKAWWICACLCRKKDIQHSVHACNKCIILIGNGLKKSPERAEEACCRLMDVCLVLRELGKHREYEACLNWVMELSREIHRSDLEDKAKQMLEAPHEPKSNCDRIIQ